eukprot:gene7154-262_t
MGLEMKDLERTSAAKGNPAPTKHYVLQSVLPTEARRDYVDNPVEDTDPLLGLCND